MKQRIYQYDQTETKELEIAKCDLIKLQSLLQIRLKNSIITVMYENPRNGSCRKIIATLQESIIDRCHNYSDLAKAKSEYLTDPFRTKGEIIYSIFNIQTGEFEKIKVKQILYFT